MSHDRWLESAAADAMDSLDVDERLPFEAHLAGCAECRLAVQEFREITGMLVLAAEPVAVPPGLRDHVGAMVHAEVTRRDDAASKRTASPVAAITARPSAWRAPATWLAAAGLLLAASTAMLWQRAAGERDAERDAAREERLALQGEISARDSILGILRGSRVQVASLAAPAGSGPVVRVFWNQERGRFVVTAFRLPAPPVGREYQLWAIAQGKPPVSMGTFVTDADGVATVVLPVGREVTALGTVELCAVTMEPAGGSAAPTETPRFVGSWRATD